jgi:catechol 2,3-dioxygenase-like lactoylglutathione lyase family enzyme
MLERMLDLPRAIGLRHLALTVADVARAEAFYVGVLGFVVEWRPDADNLYLRYGADSLAIHQYEPPASGDAGADRLAFDARRGQHLGHLGLVLSRIEDVDRWAEHVRAHGVPMLAEPRTHRDGARSFYCADPDGNAVQILYHPPISS